MTEERFQTLVMALAAQIRDIVDDLYRRQLDDALADRRVLIDLIEAHGDERMIEAARELGARRDPDRREWHHYCGNGVRH